MPDIAVHRRTSGQTEILSLEGQLDLYNTDLVSSAIDECLREGRYHIVFNLKEVDYVDSSGIGLFVRTVGRLQQFKGRIALCELTPDVRKIFALARVDSLIREFPTEAEALQFVSG